MRSVDIDLIGVPAFVIDVEPAGVFRILAINRADEEALGVRACEVVGRRIEDCVPAEMAGHVNARFRECVAKRALHEYDERFGLADRVRWWHTTLTPMVDPSSGAVVRIVGVSIEITQRKETETVLADAAFCDPLTGLANRRRLERDIEAAIARGDRAFGLVVLDLDGFKPINDTYGHRCGDDVLRHVGSLLRLAAGRGETVARLGGDEFALMLEVRDEPDLHGRTTLMARVLNRSLRVADQPVRLGASIGCAMWTGQPSFDALFDLADAEMYRDKAQRRSASAA